MELLGFWSYVHDDDQVDMGRIGQLARDIVNNYEAIRAESIKLFLDRDDLHWGDQWRDLVDSALSNVAFFIPVITPRYFTRVECRRELHFFSSRAEQLGIPQLILPILYIDVPELHVDEPEDPLMALIKDIQWTPWLEYRFKDRESGEYRQAVDALARELVRRVADVERIDIVEVVQAQAIGDEDDDEPGMIEKIAALEEAMPRWAETLDGIREEIERIGDLMSRGTTDIAETDNREKGFAARLVVARRLANDLTEPVTKIETLGHSFVADLNAIDTGVKELLNQAEQQSGLDPERQVEVCQFLQSVRLLSTSANEGLGSLEAMISASQPIEKMSKDMRQPLRRLRNSLTTMAEARQITDAWLELINSIDIECDEILDQRSD